MRQEMIRGLTQPDGWTRGPGSLPASLRASLHPPSPPPRLSSLAFAKIFVFPPAKRRSEIGLDLRGGRGGTADGWIDGCSSEGLTVQATGI